jgi:hypothetical protein
MIKAEPKTILHFLWNYFDIIHELFDIQSKEGIIRKEKLQEVCKKHDANITSQLAEYKILKPLQEDFELRLEYFNMVAYLLHEFKPLLPESIEKYNSSISELFKKIKEGVNGEKQILEDRISNLSSQITEFYESIEKNTLRLLAETRSLKANVTKIDYREKLQKASFWIEYYILPLNNILNINFADSITNKLYDISQYVNLRRLNFHDENTRQQFDKLYNQLLQTNDDLLRQSKILTNELLPLIERIRTESSILTGWIQFLKAPYKTKTPKVYKSTRAGAYSSSMYFTTREFFEQFEQDDHVYLEEETNDIEKWIFNKTFYKNKLEEKLPVSNFFSWCLKTLDEEYEVMETEKFFSLTSLLFEDDLFIEIDEKDKKQKVVLDEMTLLVPTIKINKNGIF